jgi:large subunit ribosomal protein L21
MDDRDFDNRVRHVYNSLSALYGFIDHCLYGRKFIKTTCRHQVCRFFLEAFVYAIIESGGRQYRAEEGHSFSVEKLPYEVGEQIELDRVFLLADGDEISIGQPVLEGVAVKATIVEQYRGKKIFVWKYKPSKRYRRRKGHRQSYTRLRVDEIKVG